MKPVLFSDQALELIAARFHALGETSRLKLITALEDGEKSVAELVQATCLNQSNASRQLHILTRAGILFRHREKTKVYYTVIFPEIYDTLARSQRPFGPVSIGPDIPRSELNLMNM
jgi:DNA-binding transcriptional ArsR family regulator